jgi:hypothetical protein
MLFRVLIIASLYRFFRNLLYILLMGHTNPLYGQISWQLIFDISRPVACRLELAMIYVGSVTHSTSEKTPMKFVTLCDTI